MQAALDVPSISSFGKSSRTQGQILSLTLSGEAEKKARPRPRVGITNRSVTLKNPRFLLLVFRDTVKNTAISAVPLALSFETV